MSKLMNQAVEMPPLDTAATVEALNRILHLELDGVMQESQHLWMARWLQPSRARAVAIGEQISSLTGGPSLAVDALMGQAIASADELLDAARDREVKRVAEYRKLLELVAGRNPALEAFARNQLAQASGTETQISGVTPEDA
jgi:beta-phosphoglucomutase-like phosphatase (HAD superfamily)